MLERTRQLIRQQETRGLAVAFWIRAVTLALLFVSQMVFAHDSHERHLAGLIYGPTLAVALAGLFLIRRRRYRPALGWLSLGLDMAVVIGIAFMWQESVGEGVSRAFLLKSGLPMIVYLLLAMNALSMQPVFPLLFSLAAALFYLFLLHYAALDPRVVFTGDFVTPVTGESVQLVLYLSNVFVTVVAGFFFYLVARRSRRLILESAGFEVQSASLARYFSPDVVREISGKEEDFFRPGGEVREVVVLFSDIRGFTRLSAEHPPDEVFALLSGYHAAMVEAIFENGGTLDKFIGDGIMATFGAIHGGPDNRRQALAAALAMRANLAALNAARQAAGRFTIAHGIGIHCGPVLVGNVGIAERLEFTVIGETVNTASRIEGACKELGRDLLFSAAVAGAAWEGLAVEDAGEAGLRGIEAPVRLYTLPSRKNG
jgi:adenylate cyclase